MLPFGGWHLLKCCGQSWCEPDLMMLVFDFRMISLRKKAGLAAKFFYRHHVDSIRPQEIAGKWWLFVYLGNGWFLGSTPKYVHSCMIQKGESARLKTPSFWCSKGILQGTSIPHHGKRKSSLPKCSWVFVYSLSYNNLIIYFLQWLDINWWISFLPHPSGVCLHFSRKPSEFTSSTDLVSYQMVPLVAFSIRETEEHRVISITPYKSCIWRPQNKAPFEKLMTDTGIPA